MKKTVKNVLFTIALSVVSQVLGYLVVRKLDRHMNEQEG